MLKVVVTAFLQLASIARWHSDSDEHSASMIQNYRGSTNY